VDIERLPRLSRLSSFPYKEYSKNSSGPTTRISEADPGLAIRANSQHLPECGLPDQASDFSVLSLRAGRNVQERTSFRGGRRNAALHRPPVAPSDGQRRAPGPLTRSPNTIAKVILRRARLGVIRGDNPASRVLLIARSERLLLEQRSPRS